MDADELPSRSDLALYEDALRQDWPVPRAAKKQILQVCLNLIDPDMLPPLDSDAADGEDEHALSFDQRSRIQHRAMSIIARFGDLNIRQQAVDLRRAELERRKALDRRGPEAYASPVDPAAAERALKALNGPDTDEDDDGDGERPPQPA